MSSKALREAVGRGSEALCQAVVRDRAGATPDLPLAERLNVVRVLAAARSHVESLLMSELDQLAKVYPEEDWKPSVEEERRPRDYTREEVATALRVSGWDASRQLGTAQRLNDGSAPLTAFALSEGLISLAHAHNVVRALDDFPTQLRTLIDERLIRATAGQCLTARQLGQRAERMRAQLCPQEQKDQQTYQDALRSVKIVPPRDDSAMSQLFGWLTPEAAGMLDCALSAMGQCLASGAERTVEQVRHDALKELAGRALAEGGLTGGDGSPAALQVTVPLETLLGGDAPGEIAGFGLLNPQDTRRLGCEACFAAIITSADDNQALFLGRTQRLPNRALRRFLRARDRGCLFPGCGLRPERCEPHHIHTWSTNGHTNPDNLVLLCARHHHTVHDTPWRLERQPDGVCKWTSPAGASYSVAPPDLNVTLAPLRRATSDATRRHLASAGSLQPAAGTLAAPKAALGLPDVDPLRRIYDTRAGSREVTILVPDPRQARIIARKRRYRPRNMGRLLADHDHPPAS